MKYMIGKMKVRRCGSLDGSVKPVIDYIPDEYWGVFDKNIDAKRAYVEGMEMLSPGAPNDLVRAQFDHYARNIGGAKVIKVQDDIP